MADRIEILSAAVYQSLYGSFVLEPWTLASEHMRSSVFHLVHFLEMVEVERYDRAYLIEVSRLAWDRHSARCKQESLTGSALNKALSRMVCTYLVLRELVS